MSNMPTPTDVATAIFIHKKDEGSFDSFWDDRGMPSPLGMVICEVLTPTGHETDLGWNVDISDMNNKEVVFCANLDRNAGAWEDSKVRQWIVDFNTLAKSFGIEKIEADVSENEFMEAWAVVLKII